MKNVEKLALVVIVIWALSLVTSPLFRIIIPRTLHGHPALEQIGFLPVVMSLFMSLGTVLSSIGVRIGVGIWLFIIAQRENATPWIWLLFGLFAGLIAVVLFFLMKVYEALKPLNIIEKAQPEG